MCDIKAVAAAHHDEASHQLVIAANLQGDAADHCMDGAFAEAARLARVAAEKSKLAAQHADAAVELYRQDA